MLDDTEVERVLVVAAHPDDVDFGAGGTIATWTATGIEVAYCLVTDGDAGGFDPDVPRERMPSIRRREQRAAADALGVTDVRFLGYPDGRVEVSLGLRRDLARVIREVRPQRVLVNSPERDWSRIHPSHPDHLAVGEATMAAVYPDSRNRFAFPELLRDEGLEPWTVREVWLMGGPGGDHVVDVTDVFDRKMTALRRHESQMQDDVDLEGDLRAGLAEHARAAGLAEGRLAERFRVAPTA